MAAMERIAVAQLSERDRERLGGRLPRPMPGDGALVISAPQPILTALEEYLRHLGWEESRSEQILELLTEDVGSRVLGQGRLEQLRLQAKAREHVLATCPTLTGAEVAELSGSKARNRAALASRWKREGRIFSLPEQNTDRYPLFQFGEDGRPLPVVAEILRAFEGEDGWTIAIWFAASSDWLGGRAPAEGLGEDPAAVLEAARRSAEPLEI